MGRQLWDRGSSVVDTGGGGGGGCTESELKASVNVEM